MSEPGSAPQPPNGPLSVRVVLIFYAVLVVASFGFALLFDGLRLFQWHDEHQTSLLFEVAAGVGSGLAVVGLSRVLYRTTEWAQRLGEEFGRILGNLSLGSIFVVACASAFAEELFFRGFLQQMLSDFVFGEPNGRWWGLGVATVIFGGLHVGPDPETFLPWTAMAVVFGGMFGWMYLYTGSLLAPVLAHFTINFLNIHFISQNYGVPPNSDD